jgi:hypothetical protein
VRTVAAIYVFAFALLASPRMTSAAGSSSGCDGPRGPVGAVGVMLLGVAIIVIALGRHRR